MTKEQLPPDLQDLVSPAMNRQIDELLAKVQQDEQAGRRAMAEIKPGPLRDIFALAPDIQVGKWSVRPFYDIDIEVLQELKHPLYDELMSSMNSQEPKADYVPRGQSAWTLFWMMTHTPEEVEASLGASGGLRKIEVLGKAEFGRLRLPALVELYKAVVRQVVVFSSAAISYGPASEGGADEQLPPPSSDSTPTATAGS